jgi:hypothetical protein
MVSLFVSVYSIIFFFPYTYMVCTYMVIHLYTYVGVYVYEYVVHLYPYYVQYSIYPLYSFPPSYYTGAYCLQSLFNTESRPRSPFPTHGKGSGGEDGVPCAAHRPLFKMKNSPYK